MICEPCKLAGIRFSEGFLKRAMTAHGNCEHPATCPCQHKVGEDE